MPDALRLAILLLVLLDPVSAAIGASTLATSRSEPDRRVVVGGGALVVFALLAVVASIADRLLGALHISDPAAELAAGLVVLVLVLDLLWQGPAARVRPAARATAWRLCVFPYAVPLLAGPAVVAAAIAWSATEGTGVTIGAAALASAAVALIAFFWRRPPTGAGARALGAFVAVAMALIAFDLVRDGIFGT
jgi:multiple antibiotic resistance protein